MTKAFNLSQLANNVNSAGQLDGQLGINGPVNQSASLVTSNFTVQEVSGTLYFYYGATPIAKMDASGNFTTLNDITAYGSI